MIFNNNPVARLAARRTLKRGARVRIPADSFLINENKVCMEISKFLWSLEGIQTVEEKLSEAESLIPYGP